MTTPHGRDPLAVLNAGQLDVLRLTADGRTVKETAVALGMAPKTVQDRRCRILDRLLVPSMEAACFRLGFELGRAAERGEEGEMVTWK